MLRILVYSLVLFTKLIGQGQIKSWDNTSSDDNIDAMFFGCVNSGMSGNTRMQIVKQVT